LHFSHTKKFVPFARWDFRVTGKGCKTGVCVIVYAHVYGKLFVINCCSNSESVSTTVKKDNVCRPVQQLCHELWAWQGVRLRRQHTSWWV